MEVEGFISEYANGDPTGLRRALHENFRALNKLYGCPRDKIEINRESYRMVHEALRNGPWNLSQKALKLLDTNEDEFLNYFNQLQEC